jgi:hypothetical protein
MPSHVVVESPNKPRPPNPVIRYLADTLRHIEINYEREGSGPGSRFEGELLEDVQARTVLRILLPALQQRVPPAGWSLEWVAALWELQGREAPDAGPRS